VQHHHTLLIWSCYFFGQVLHVLYDASTTVHDKLVPSITTFRQYFAKFATAIAVRFFILSCIFPFLWDNPSAFDIEGIVKGSGHQIAASGIVGYFCDSFGDKGLALLGIKAKLPALPGAAADVGAKP
jgi:hypothetical protein